MNNRDLEAELFELEQTVHHNLHESKDAYLVELDESNPEFRANRKRLTEDLMIKNLRRALANKPSNQSILCGIVTLGIRPQGEGDHFGSFVIDMKNKTAIVFDPFGHDSNYITGDIERAIKVVFGNDFTVIKNQTNFQHDGVNCGGISRDALTFLVNQCSDNPDPNRLTAARDSLDANSRMIAKWRRAQTTQTAEDTRVLKEQRAQFNVRFKTKLAYILEHQLDLRVNEALMINVRRNAPRPDSPPTQIAFNSALKEYLKNRVFHSSFLRKQFLQLSEEAQKQLISNLALEITKTPLQQDPRRHDAYDVVLSQQELDRCQSIVEQALTQVRQQQQRQPVPDNRNIANPPRNGSTQNINSALHVPQNVAAVSQVPKKEAVPQAAVTNRTKSTTRDSVNRKVRIIDGQNKIIISQGKTSSLTLRQGQQAPIEINNINLVIMSATLIKNEQGKNNLLFVGTSKRIQQLDLSHPEQPPVPVGPTHKSYISSLDIFKRDNKELIITSSADNVHVWDRSGLYNQTINIPGSRVITSAVGLDNGWIACTNRLGFLYLIDPQQNVYKYNDGETAEMKRGQSNKLNTLSIQDGKLIQHAGNSINSRERRTFDLNNINPHNPNLVFVPSKKTLNENAQPREENPPSYRRGV